MIESPFLGNIFFWGAMQAQIMYAPGHELGRLLQPINLDVFEQTFFVGVWYICRVSSRLFFISTLIPHRFLVLSSQTTF